MRPGSPFPFKMALLFLVATVAFTSANAQLKRKQIIDEKKSSITKIRNERCSCKYTYNE